MGDALDALMEKWGHLFILLRPAKSVQLKGALKWSSFITASTFGTLEIMP